MARQGQTGRSGEHRSVRKSHHYLAPAIGGGALVALIVGFFVAVAAVRGSGDCWSNCDPDVDALYNGAPLGIWAIAAGLSWATFCLYLWAQLYRSQAVWRDQVEAALVALVVTAPLVAIVAGLLGP